MEHQHARLLVESEIVRVFDVHCWAPRSGYGAMEFNTVAQIGLPRRGVFLVERGRQRVVIDTNTAWLLGPNDEYRVGHPTDDGDDGTVLAFAPELLEESLGGLGGRVAQLRPRQQLVACLLTRAFAGPGLDRLEADDAALLLLAALAPSFTDSGAHASDCRLGPAQRLRIEQARALLASSPANRWHIAGLARALGCSPFHLARQFRAATGETISRYVLRLRLAVALERLADGERNLAALALELGFTHHSHFSARFRTAFGITPSDAREILTKRRVDELRALAATGVGGG
jgi:AraC family transcriptional regulator